MSVLARGVTFGGLFLVAALLIGRGAVAPVSPAAAQEAVWVSMQGDQFWPDTITIAAGTTVVWSNDEADPTNAHNVIDARGAFESPPSINPGETWSFTFTEPGDYLYYCDLHEGMYGRVIVE